MKTIFKKTFIDIHEEEEWLNEQGSKGLMLINYCNGKYEFEDVSPASYQYKIDLPNYIGSNKKDYLNFLEQTGISVVAEYGGRVYLRKNVNDGPLNLYTDNKEIAKQMSKRYYHFFTIGISLFIAGVVILLSNLINLERGSALFWFTLIIEIGMMISGIIFFVFGVKKHKKYSVPKEEIDIWE